MRVKFLGSGDAFGSGGRYNACFLLEARERRYLIDCGASSMIAIRKFEIDPNTIDAIFVSHFDIDHFGGAPLLAMEGHLIGERTRPLAIAGPVGLRHRFYQWIDLSLPSRLISRQLRYELNLVELAPERGEVEIAGVRVAASDQWASVGLHWRYRLGRLTRSVWAWRRPPYSRGLAL
jgi:ribonuclease BN (tRNA processing enzyme)